MLNGFLSFLQASLRENPFACQTDSLGQAVARDAIASSELHTYVERSAFIEMCVQLPKMPAIGRMLCYLCYESPVPTLLTLDALLRLVAIGSMPLPLASSSNSAAFPGGGGLTLRSSASTMSSSTSISGANDVKALLDLLMQLLSIPDSWQTFRMHVVLGGAERVYRDGKMFCKQNATWKCF